MSTNDIAVTATEYAAGLRALADLIEEHGLPASRRHPKQALTTTIFVESVAAVKDFAATHDLPVDVNGNHTTVQLVTGPNPNTYHEGTAVLTVVHIDKSDETEAVEEPAPEHTPDDDEGTLPGDEPVYLELDGVVMKTTADDDNLPDLEDTGWHRISRDEAMSWQPLDDTAAGDESAAVPATELDAPVPYVRVERVDPDDPTSMVLPVIGDTVSLHDGTIARVESRPRYQNGNGWDERWKVAPLDRAAPREVTLDEIAGYPDEETVRFAKVLAEVAAVSAANNREDAPALVQLDQAEATAKVLEAADAWLDAPDGDDVGEVMRLAAAIRARRAVQS